MQPTHQRLTGCVKGQTKKGCQAPAVPQVFKNAGEQYFENSNKKAIFT